MIYGTLTPYTYLACIIITVVGSGYNYFENKLLKKRLYRRDFVNLIFVDISLLVKCACDLLRESLYPSKYTRSATYYYTVYNDKTPACLGRASNLCLLYSA